MAVPAVNFLPTQRSDSTGVVDATPKAKEAAPVPSSPRSARGPKPEIENAQLRAIVAAQQVPVKLPFSPTRVLPNGMIMMSGTLPFTAPGVVLQGTAEEVTAQIFVNIKAELTKLGLTLNDVVDVTVLMTNLKNDYASMNAAYAKEFAGVDNMPTRMAYGVSELPFGASIEIKCTAYKAQ